MKLKYLLGWILAGGVALPLQAQNDVSASAKESETGTDSSVDASDIELSSGETSTIFSKSTPAGKVGCTLLKNKWRDRKIYSRKNGYKIITSDNDEVIDVTYKANGGKKIKYYNDYESLNYHLKGDGKFHYSYSYFNDCNKVTLKRKKNGVTSLTNKSGMDLETVRGNVRNAIQYGVQSCANIR
jgi:hypothetical protein